MAKNENQENGREVFLWGEPKELLAVSILYVAMLTDFFERRVYNCWIATGLVMGIVLKAIHMTGLSVMQMASGFLLPLILCGILFFIHVLGAGDLKLLMFLGMLYGPYYISDVMVVFFLLGAGVSFVYLLIRRQMIQAISEVISYIRTSIITKKISIYSGSQIEARTIPMSGILMVSYLLILTGRWLLA